ncbi:MAG: hypothetical protein ACRERE_19560 [Candidatus Entotheonellia bacterium]
MRLPLATLGELFVGLPVYRLKSLPGATVPLLSVKDVAHADDALWQLPLVTVPDLSRVERYRLKTNDVVITARGTSLKSAIIPERWNGALLSSNLIAVRLGERLHPELLLVFLQSAAGRQAIERRLTGSHLLALTPRSLGEVEVPVPSAAEQEVLAELVALARRQYQEALFIAEMRRQLAHRIVFERLRGTGTTSEAEGISENRQHQPTL